MARGQGITISTHDFNPARRRAFDERGIWCRPCGEDLGEKRKAHRVMPKGGGLCEEHYRHEAGEPQRTPEAQSFIERWKRIVQATRRGRANGLRFERG